MFVAGDRQTKLKGMTHKSVWILLALGFAAVIAQGKVKHYQ